MRDTRQDILETAKRLFNERGYNDVSTRDIAGELGISKGNLTYYFKRKEAIIEALLAENPRVKTRQAPKTLAGLNDFFTDIQKTVQENAFYFWHHAQLAQVSPAIQKRQSEVFRENIALLGTTFRALRNKGMLKEEQYPGETQYVINTLLLTGIYWMPFCNLTDAPKVSFVRQAWSIVYPYLTKAGAEEATAFAEL